MTTELGFGELELPSGKLVGLVDVPGHALYLRAMVQGATGVGVALLVVSAVEGVMPQTREHVYVLELLGVRHLVVHSRCAIWPMTRRRSSPSST